MFEKLCVVTSLSYFQKANVLSAFLDLRGNARIYVGSESNRCSDLWFDVDHCLLEDTELNHFDMPDLICQSTLCLG